MAGEGIAFDADRVLELLASAEWAAQGTPTGFDALVRATSAHLEAASRDRFLRYDQFLEYGHEWQYPRVGHRGDSEADTGQLPVPTQDDLAEADTELRDHVLPAMTEEEMLDAVGDLIHDPGKRKLAVFFTDLVHRAPTIPPWLWFVLAYWVAMQMSATQVGAVGVGLGVAAYAKQKKKG